MDNDECLSVMYMYISHFFFKILPITQSTSDRLEEERSKSIQGEMSNYYNGSIIDIKLYVDVEISSSYNISYLTPHIHTHTRRRLHAPLCPWIEFNTLWKLSKAL